MAQFPSKAIAELSYEFRTLGLGFANIGGLLMTMGLPYDSKEAPLAVRRADRRHDRRGVCAPRPRWPRSSAPSPATRRTPQHMLRVIRNHRRAAHGESRGYEALAVSPCRSITPPARKPTSITHAKAAWDKALELRRTQRLPQRADHRGGADRHHRPRDGLRHHRHRA